MPSERRPGCFNLIAACSLCSVSLKHAAFIVLPWSRNSISSGALWLQKKSRSPYHYCFVHLLPFFGDREAEFFHGLLWYLLSGWKWKHHIFTPSNNSVHKSVSFLVESDQIFQCQTHLMIIFSWRQVMRDLLGAYCSENQMFPEVSWTLPKWIPVSSDVTHNVILLFLWMTLSTWAMVLSLITWCAGPRHGLSWSNFCPAWNSFRQDREMLLSPIHISCVSIDICSWNIFSNQEADYCLLFFTYIHFLCLIEHLASCCSLLCDIWRSFVCTHWPELLLSFQ